MKRARHFSAGGIVIHEEKVLLIRPAGERDIWTFPKGTIEKGESRAQAALREVREETGYACRILGPLDSSTYRFRIREVLVDKRVFWFLMKPIEQVGAPDAEVARSRWTPMESAFQVLTYDSDRQLLEEAVKTMKESRGED